MRLGRNRWLAGVAAVIGMALASDAALAKQSDQPIDRPALRGLGDVSPQGLARRSQSHLCLADQRLVRPDHPALRRWRQDLAPAGNTGRRTTTAPDGSPKGESNKFVYDTRRPAPMTTHQWYDGTQHPWEFKRVWHLEPSLTDPDTVYAGVEDAAMFRSTDGGKNWQELPACADTAPAPSGSRARAACVCTPSFSIPSNPQADVHRHLGGGRVPHRRRRQDVGSRSIAGCVRNTFLTRRPRSATASTTSP